MPIDHDGKDAAGSPPEVDVEVVSEHSIGDLNVDGVRAENKPPQASQKAFPLFPGLIVFFVFVAAVLGAFLIWRLQEPPKSKSETGQPTAARQTQSPARSTLTKTPGSANNSDAGTAANAAKISNGIGDVKNEALNYDFGDSIDKGPGLPPPPPSSTFDNSSLQQAAKDAHDLFGQEEPPSKNPTEFEIAPTVPEAESKAEERADGAASVQTFTHSMGQQNENATLHAANGEDVRNDLATLKAILEEEREASRTQAEEIAALRARLSEESSGDALHAAPNEFAAANISNLHSADPVKLSLALLSLNRAIEGGKSYQEEVERVAHMAPEGAPGLSILKAHAAEGVPTLSALTESFPQTAREALAAANRENAKGPLGAVMARLSGLVSVRPATPQSGSGAPAVVSRAEARLGDDDLEGAIEELNSLSGGAAQSFAPWLAGARARSDALQAASLLGNALAEQQP